MLIRFLLWQDLYKISACPRVVDITKRKPGEEYVVDRANPAEQLVSSTAGLAALQKRATEVRENGFLKTWICFSLSFWQKKCIDSYKLFNIWCGKCTGEFIISLCHRPRRNNTWLRRFETSRPHLTKQYWLKVNCLAFDLGRPGWWVAHNFGLYYTLLKTLAFRYTNHLSCITFHFSIRQLQVQVMNLMAANRTGGQIQADFSAFPTPAYAKVGSLCVNFI